MRPAVRGGGGEPLLTRSPLEDVAAPEPGMVVGTGGGALVGGEAGAAVVAGAPLAVAPLVAGAQLAGAAFAGAPLAGAPLAGGAAPVSNSRCRWASLSRLARRYVEPAALGLE